MAKKTYNEIKYRIPYSAISFENYDITSIIGNEKEFEEIIDKKISQLKKEKVNISMCIGYLESLIEEYISSLLGKLEKKHIKQKNNINNIFNRRAADRVELELLIQNIREQIVTVNQNLELVQKLYDEYNPLQEIKKKMDDINDINNYTDETLEEEENNEK